MPLLANVFLHYVLDEWFEQEVKPRLRGRAYRIRYADDFVIGFTHEDDARRVLAVLPKRFGKYGLTLHPDKTRLVPFHRPPRRATGKGDDGHQRPVTFDLLGFTHHWGRSRRGFWVIMRQTASKRLSRAIGNVAEWCRLNRHRPVAEQHETLSQKVRGHCAYYGITGNGRALSNFRYAVQRCWQKWLNRRNCQREMDWDRFNRLLQRYPLPAVKIVHSVYAKQRNHGLRNRMLECVHVRVCGSPGRATAQAHLAAASCSRVSKSSCVPVSIPGGLCWIGGAP